MTMLIKDDYDDHDESGVGEDGDEQLLGLVLCVEKNMLMLDMRTYLRVCSPS